MIKCKDGKIIFSNVKEFNNEISRRFKPKIDAEIKKIYIEYETELENLKRQSTEAAINLMLPIVFAAMHEAFGFGKTRLSRFQECFEKQIECIGEGVTDVEQYKKWCLEQGYEYIPEITPENIEQ